MKTAFILSMTPLGWLTFGIWPLVMSILLIARSNQFQNQTYALVTGIISLVLGYLLVGFIMGLFLVPNYSANTNAVELQVNTN